MLLTDPITNQSFIQKIPRQNSYQQKTKDYNYKQQINSKPDPNIITSEIYLWDT